MEDSKAAVNLQALSNKDEVEKSQSTLTTLLLDSVPNNKLTSSSVLRCAGQ